MVPLEVTSSCSLCVIDVQERLLSAMPEREAARVVRSVEALVALATMQGAGLLYTEQYPRGLGATSAALRDALTQAGAERFEKVHFDAFASPEFQARADRLKKRVIVCGMETHICVLATVRSLIATGHQVLVPFDATLSRAGEHHANGLALMASAGAVIVNTETLIFQSLGSSRHAEFKRFSAMIK